MQGEKGGYLKVRDLFSLSLGAFLINCAKVTHPFLPNTWGLTNLAYYFRLTEQVKKKTTMKVSMRRPS